MKLRSKQLPTAFLGFPYQSEVGNNESPEGSHHIQHFPSTLKPGSIRQCTSSKHSVSQLSICHPIFNITEELYPLLGVWGFCEARTLLFRKTNSPAGPTVTPKAGDRSNYANNLRAEIPPAQLYISCRVVAPHLKSTMSHPTITKGAGASVIITVPPEWFISVSAVSGHRASLIV